MSGADFLLPPRWRELKSDRSSRIDRPCSAWDGRADQVNHRVVGPQLRLDRFGFEGIADNRRRAHGNTAHRRRARERAHSMPARKQHGNQLSADVAGAAGDKNIECHLFVQRCEKILLRRRRLIMPDEFLLRRERTEVRETGKLSSFRARRRFDHFNFAKPLFCGS